MTDQKKNKWLKVFCPEDVCMAEEVRIALPECEMAEKHTSKWLNLFCPGGSCEINSSTQLP